MTWSYIWSTFTATPFTWLIYLQGILTALVILRSKKATRFLAFSIWAATLSGACWMLSVAKEQNLPALGDAGIGWLALSFVWMFFWIHLHREWRKTHPKKP